MNIFTALVYAIMVTESSTTIYRVILLTFTQNVFCRRLQDRINDGMNHKQYSTLYESDSLYSTWGHGTEGDDLYRDRIIYPDSDWSAIVTPFSARQPKIEACVTSCSPNIERHPVCGTDGYTYYNRDQLECYMRCGVDVRIQDLSPCPEWDGTTLTPAISTSTPSLKSCLSSCPSTPEYNPVCGTDNLTYTNHGKLMCAQHCGKDVQLQRRSPCSKISPQSESSTTTFRTTTISDESRSCIASCPSTGEYRPVCGTNRVTYLNLSRLQCHRSCGVDVALLKEVACHVEGTNNPNTIS